VLLLHRGAKAADTIATLAGQYFGMTNTRKTINGKSIGYAAMLNPLQTHEQAVLFRTGEIALAHFAPYRVDWRSADGKWTRGRPIAEPVVAATPAIRESVAGAQKHTDDGRALFSADDFPPWPSTVPPFTRDALLAGIDGRLYVTRTHLAYDAPYEIDVFDASTARIGTITLPKGTRLVGVGMRGLYVAKRDQDDEELLMRLRVVRPGG
jgi:hypothetical protein